MKETFVVAESLTEKQRVDRILNTIRKRNGWKLGDFILYLFSEGNEVKISLSASASIDSFLKGHSRTTAKDIIDLMFNNSASAKRSPQ